VIEGFCDVVLPGDCDAPAAVYLPGEPAAVDCRFGENKVGMLVQVTPAPGGKGTFVPVRVLLSNTSTGGWAKPLSEVRVLLTLNPLEEVEGKIGYVMGSVLLEGGDMHVENDTIESMSDRVIFRLFKPEPDEGEELQMMPAPGGGLWALDFMLMRGGNAEGVFKVDVWTPCEASPQEIGCHDSYPYGDNLEKVNELSFGQVSLQRISASSYVSSSGQIVDPEDAENVGELLRSPVLGCQCGTREGSGSAWVLLLGLLWVVRRKVRV